MSLERICFLQESKKAGFGTEGGEGKLRRSGSVSAFPPDCYAVRFSPDDDDGDVVSLV